MKNNKLFVAVTLAVMSTSQFALAQDEAESGATEEVTAPSEPAISTGSGDFAFKSGSKGIGVIFPTGGSQTTADIVWGLGANTALDLQVGLTIAHASTEPDPITGESNSDTAVGLDLTLGYRMYKPFSGAIHPFLEPFVSVASADLGEMSDNVELGAGAMLGVELEVFKQFSLGSAVGAGFISTNALDNYVLGLFTSPIIATFWWN